MFTRLSLVLVIKYRYFLLGRRRRVDSAELLLQNEVESLFGDGLTVVFEKLSEKSNF